MLTKYVIIICFLFSNILADPCGKWMTCHECITDPSVCAYCAMDNFSGVRCRSQSENDNAWCPNNLQIPITNVKPSMNANYSDDKKHFVQIKPQQFQITLQTGKPAPFNFSFQGAANFPVDLYFLMDASKSMNLTKTETARQSKHIYEYFKTATNDVYFGLGTFIDKRLYPMTDQFDAKQTYSFRHHMKLNADYKLFEQEVSMIDLGTNVDGQEGGLDALAQIMACGLTDNDENLIGWRKESRKIIVYMSDGPYHAAGDGRAAGVFQPYDGRCYTNNITYTYSRELDMDYPSVAMINNLAIQNDIIIAFLVFGSSKNLRNVYTDLTNLISGSVLPESGHGSEYVKVFKDIYEKISRKITLKVKSVNRRNFEITFNPNCTLDNDDDRCVLVKGKENQFTGTIKLLKYDGIDKTKVDIYVEGTGEKLTLNIDVANKCECESKAEEHSTLCSGEKRVCGGCSCGDKKYGVACECSYGNNIINSNNSSCIENGTVCNGRGECECGACICRNGYTGPFCQCSDSSCARNLETQEECNGIEHGECVCGTCNCKGGWTGDACQCTPFNTTCMTPDRNVCYGHGYCQCGKCQCKEISAWDARSEGENCKMTCTDCHDFQCLKLETCALCKRVENEHCDCDGVTSEVQETLADDVINNTRWKLCASLKTATGCYSKFVYRYKDAEYGVHLIVQKGQNCAESYILFGGIFFGTLILIGIGTLIAWKVLITMRDRREYERFIRQHNCNQTGPNENPLYAPPVVKFVNPAFRKGSIR